MVGVERNHYIVLATYGRLRVYLFVTATLIYVSSLLMGYAINPPQEFVMEVREFQERQIEFLRQLSETSPVAAFVYKLGLVMNVAGPALIPLFGIWYASSSLVTFGVVAAALPEQAMSILASSIILAFIMAMPSSDGLMLMASLVDRFRRGALGAALPQAARWYAASLILALILLMLYALLA